MEGGSRAEACGMSGRKSRSGDSNGSGSSCISSGRKEAAAGEGEEQERGVRIGGLGSGGSSNMKGQTREVVLVVRPARMKALDRREEFGSLSGRRSSSRRCI